MSSPVEQCSIMNLMAKRLYKVADTKCQHMLKSKFNHGNSLKKWRPMKQMKNFIESTREIDLHNSIFLLTYRKIWNKKTQPKN